MHITTNGERRFLSWLIVAGALATAGCESVAHIRTFRDARRVYNQTTGEANDVTLAHVLPADGLSATTPANWGVSQKQLSTGFENGDYLRLHEQYAEVALILGALHGNKPAKQALVKDRLYATSATLQLMAEWKAAFYLRLLGIETATEEGGEVVLPGDSDGPDATFTFDLEDTPSMLDVRARRGALLAEIEGLEQVAFPRDRFFLAAIDALTRYDNAYLTAVEWARAGRFEPTTSPLDDVGRIVEEMATAEEMLAKVVERGRYGGQVEYLSIVARLAILRTASSLVTAGEVKFVTRDDGSQAIWTQEDAAEALPRLTRRIVALVDEASRPGSAAGRLAERLGLDENGLYGAIGMYWESRRAP